MAMNPDRPNNEASLQASTTSIGATPVAGWTVATNAGQLQRVFASAGGTTIGTIIVAVAINGGSDITSGGLTIAAGTGARAASTYEFQTNIGSAVVYVNEGDIISFTPSLGGGVSVPGAFGAVIRTI
jgi:hypothetical protein